MKKHLESFIKPLIDEFPQLGDILNSYGVGCTDCQVGTCKLIDIIKIHNLKEEDTQKMIRQMGEVIYKGGAFEIPEIEHEVVENKSSFSPPIRKLVDEHVYIMKVISAMPAILDRLAADVDGTLPYIKKGIAFIKFYADGYHHAKEEDLLFEFFDNALDIIQVMFKDHDTGRNFVKNTVQGIEDRDVGAITENLTGYCTLLKGHIKKEDEVLYPWMDRTLTTPQVGELFSQCQQVETDFGDMPKEYEEFALAVEKEFSGVAA
jgi:hemerythrin-like domain-containing protein